MKPLIVNVHVNATSEMIAANIEASLRRGLPMLKPNTCNGAISIAGAGPSLAETYKDLVGAVLACNSAHDYLIGNGVKPKYAMLWDANPIMADMFTPCDGVTYLIATRCHPSVFEKLKGNEVVMWHALGDDELMPLLYKYKREEMMVAGGSSSVLRATHVAGAFGYKDQHLFGVDSCYRDKETHVAGSPILHERLNMQCCGKAFQVAPWMAKQAEEFKAIAPILKENGVKLTVHGTGLIPYLATFLGCETPDIKVGWMEKRLLRPVQSIRALYALLRFAPTTLETSNAGI